MAINIPIITSLEDTGIKNAKAAFNDFKTAVGNAEGGMGKFKAGSTAALDAVKANAAAFAVAAAGSIIAFAKASVTAFQDLALSASKFADASGLAVEDASRYIEAAGDIGIPVDALESAIGRLNRTIGADPDKVRNLGVDLVYLKNGSLDVNETFLNTIQRIKDIKDPAEKATVAAQLLGKGWQSMSELIDMGAGDLKKSLDSVSDSKVIDEKEVKKAKDFRASMDKLGDEFQDMALELGEQLVPQLVIAVEKMAKLAEFAGFFLKGAGGAVELSKEQLAEFGDKAAIAEIAAEKLGEAYRDSVPNALGFVLLEVNEALEEQEEIVTTLTTEWQTLLGTLDTREAFDNLEESLENVFVAGIEAFGGTAEEVRNFNEAQKDAIEKIANLAIAMDLTFGEQNKLKIYVDSGDLAAAANYLNLIRTGYGVDFGFGIGIVPPKPQALGGPVMGGTTYLVGEQGPELFTPSSAGNITPNHALGGGGTITVNVNGGDPDAVVRAIQKYARQNGAIPLQTTTSARF
jgi:hypothetical protein